MDLLSPHPLPRSKKSNKNPFGTQNIVKSTLLAEGVVLNFFRTGVVNAMEAALDSGVEMVDPALVASQNSEQKCISLHLVAQEMLQACSHSLCLVVWSELARHPLQ
jgi:hypothetical protein